MAKLKKNFVTAIFLSFSFAIFAQGNGVKIEGKVIDSKTQEPIIGATVALVNTSKGAATNIEGQFTFTVPSLPATLKVEYVGYRNLEIDIYEYTEPLEIVLAEASSFINEVVVIGYGTQTRKELTSAITSVPKERLLQVTPNIESTLSGSVAGLNVSANSGQPGATSNIRIRGGNSITGSNEPLYVIDGFIIYNDVSATNTGAVRSEAILNPLQAINPADIESIDVLKDVAATAIYGTRGANGVIIITTKRGKKGSNNINYQASFGYQNIRKKVPFLDAQQYTELYNEIRTREGITDLLPNPTDSYDWQDAALRTGFQQNHQLSFVGGDEKSRYAISGNYTTQEGIVLGTDLKRYGARINLERDVFEKLRIGVNATGSYVQSNGLNNRNENNAPNTWIAAITTAPIIPIYNADGSFNYEPNVLSTSIYNGKITNPISDLVNQAALTENTRVLGIFFAEYEVLKELKLKANVGADLSNTKQSNYSPSYTAGGAANSGIANLGQKSVNSWQTEYTATYANIFNRIHSLTALAGYTEQRTDRNAFTASARGFANDLTGYNNIRGGATAEFPTSLKEVSTIHSILARVSYSLKEKYNATATFRTDGSSKFSPGHKWGFFPSLGVSWNIDKESFLNDYRHKISHLQLRLSGGSVGNQEIGDYRYISNVVPTSYYFNGKPSTAYILQNQSNENLRWETTASYNIGLNAGFLDDRLNFTFDAYYKLTTDLLLDVPVEDVIGFTSALRNVGSVSNKGVEFEVNGTIFDKRNLKWTAGFNLAHNVNRVESLGNVEAFRPSFEGVGTVNYISPLIVKEGEPLGSFYGYKFAGIVKSTDDISKFPPQTTETLAPGVARYHDISGPDGVPDGRVTEDDRTILGNSQPLFTAGINTTFSYKQWDLFVALHASYGNKLFNALRTRFEKTSTDYNSIATVANRWTPTHEESTIARATNSTSIVTDDRFVEDASYLKARNITLGYTLPFKQITKDTKIRIFATLQNFLTWTKYSGYDPESNRNGVDENNGLYQGVDFGTYPSAKTVLFGFGLTL
jgi:TonB-linked SusC/RagA family outer membrane protein